MDHRRAELPPLTPGGADLHLHSTASDGALSPREVVRQAARVGLSVVALTDHDTIAGVAEAMAEGARLGLDVVAGCELAVRGPAGELHLLAYHLPDQDPELAEFLDRAHASREARAARMVSQLSARGIAISLDDVQAEARGAPIGRPHLARVLVARGLVNSFGDAFDRLLGHGRPGFVPKHLPELRDATDLVRRLGGATSAAHLGHRGTRDFLAKLASAGVDAVEVVHPSHGAEARDRLHRLAGELHLLRTGGSDWHGSAELSPSHGTLGDQRVPLEWAEALRRRATSRVSG